MVKILFDFHNDAFPKRLVISNWVLLFCLGSSFVRFVVESLLLFYFIGWFVEKVVGDCGLFFPYHLKIFAIYSKKTFVESGDVFMKLFSFVHFFFGFIFLILFLPMKSLLFCCCCSFFFTHFYFHFFARIPV